MLIDIKTLNVTEELFHAGKNHGKKLATNPNTGLKIQYDDEKDRFEITYNGVLGYWKDHYFFVPASSKKLPEPVNEHKTEDKSKRSKAQVSTPQSHVFSSGPGLK